MNYGWLGVQNSNFVDLWGEPNKGYSCVEALEWPSSNEEQQKMCKVVSSGCYGPGNKNNQYWIVFSHFLLAANAN